jgi:hypothetical protein
MSLSLIVEQNRNREGYGYLKARELFQRLKRHVRSTPIHRIRRIYLCVTASRPFPHSQNTAYLDGSVAVVIQITTLLVGMIRQENPIWVDGASCTTRI